MSRRILKWIFQFPMLAYAKSRIEEVGAHALSSGPVPNHVAFVMDGNRRFAKENNIPLYEGHTAGFYTFSRIVEFCSNAGIKAVTVYAFSIENFKRSAEEVDALFDMIRVKIVPAMADMGNTSNSAIDKKHGVKVKVIGNREYIPEDILRSIEEIEEKTANNSKMLLNIAFAYTSRDDITQAIKRVIKNIETDKMTLEEINLDTFESELYTSEAPPLDILIRTSGNTRLSDFMLWETNSSVQVEFCRALWPNFTVSDLYRIILKWNYKRQRQLQSSMYLLENKPLPPAPPKFSIQDTGFPTSLSKISQ